jgi:hypothetical protein
MQKTAYVQSLASNPQASQIGSLDDANTLLTINTPDVKGQITDAATKQIDTLPEPARQRALDVFMAQQKEFASKVTDAFSDSLQRIFITASIMIGISTILVFGLKERRLKSASPDATPGEM